MTTRGKNWSDKKLAKLHEKELDAILGVKPATKPSLEISSETGLPCELFR